MVTFLRHHIHELQTVKNSPVFIAHLVANVCIYKILMKIRSVFPEIRAQL